MVMEGRFETLAGEQVEISSEVVLEYSSSDVAYYILNEEDDIGRKIKCARIQAFSSVDLPPFCRIEMKSVSWIRSTVR